MNEKNELIDEDFLNIISENEELDLKYVKQVVLIIVIVMMFLFPKIYIQQQIYFKSREISKLKSEYDILKEEQKVIGASVENIRFKDQILDTMF